MGHGGASGAIADDETMTWVSDPLRNNVAEPLVGVRFALEGGGATGSGKFFDVLPTGRVRLTE